MSKKFSIEAPAEVSYVRPSDVVPCPFILS